MSDPNADATRIEKWRWKPGQTGNPKGRPRGRPFKDAIDRIIASAGDGEGGNKILEAAAAALLAKASDGDVGALKELADRMDGKVPQAVTNDDEAGPVKLEITWGVPKNQGDRDGED